MTQQQQIREWLHEFGEITPAKMAGKIYKDRMFGSETSRACRAMRKAKILESESRGKFEVFWLAGRKPTPQYQTYEVPSKSKPGTVHQVVDLITTKVCDCFHYKHFGYCSHQQKTPEAQKINQGRLL